MSESPGKAVFLSYASQDAEAARRMCDSLRAVGVEVWFDQNELVGGDAWDATIRKQIAECALFVPVVSANTQARREGYFRLEWRIAAQRTHMIADGTPFLVPVVIDDTRDGEALVPPEFKSVQWTRLPDGETPEKFCARVKALLGGHAVGGALRPDLDPRAAGSGDKAPPTAPLRQPSRPWLVPAIMGIGLVVAVAVFFALRPRRSPEEIATAHASTQPAAARAAAKSSAGAEPLSATRKLVAQAREILERGDDSNHETLLLAEELLKQAQTLDATDGEVWAAEAQISRLMLLVGSDRSRTRRELLKQQAERAIALRPASIEAQVAYAGFLSQAGQAGAAEAVRRLEPLTAQYPSHRGMFDALGLAYSSAGDPDAAARAFDRANALPGGDANALAQKGAQMIWHGRYAEAEQALIQSRAIRESGRADVFGVLLTLSWRGDLDGAAAAVERWPAWLKLEPRGAIMASQVWLWRREPEKAIAVLKALASEAWSDTLFTGPKSVLLALAYEMAGQSQAAHGEWENVKKVAERQIAEDATVRAALVYKACALVRLGDAAAAEKILREVEQAKDLRSEFWSCAAPSALLRVMLDHGAELTAKFDTEPRSPRVERGYPTPRAALQLNPVFDPVRATPEFQKWMAAAPHPSAAAASDQRSAPADKSVAVLAFADNSPAHDSEYFSDGISDELINALGKVPGLKVPARTSSFYFKGKQVPMPEIAKQLGVAYVIEGSVQRMGDKVKIWASLSKAADGFQEMSETFTRDAKDVFAVEEEIAGLIAKKLSLKLGVSSAAATGSVNPEAFECYVRAGQLMHLRDGPYVNSDRAEELLNRALKLDPGFSRAGVLLTEIAVTRAWMVTRSVGQFGQRNSAAQVGLQGKARAAVRLAPDSAEARTVLGLTLQIGWQSGESERELRAALALNPNYAEARRRLGLVLMEDGRMDEALAEMKLATQLDPFAQDGVEEFGRVLHVAGRYSEAIVNYDRALALGDSIIGSAHKSYALAQFGRTSDALTVARALPLRGMVFRTLAVAGLKAEAEKLAGDGTNRAYVLAVLGRTEEALAALDVSKVDFSNLHDWFFEPWADPVRTDPRFVRFLATLGVTGAHARAQAWRAAHPPEKAAAKP